MLSQSHVLARNTFENNALYITHHKLKNDTPALCDSLKFKKAKDSPSPMKEYFPCIPLEIISNSTNVSY